MFVPWSSQSNIGQMLLSSHIELETLGTVAGNVVVEIGHPDVNGPTGEVFGSRVTSETWEKVIDRLSRAAAKLGADGVHSICLSRKVQDGERGITEFLGKGIAVRGMRQDRIWTTEATPSEIILLGDAGYAPRCLVLGSCTWCQLCEGWKPNGTKKGGIAPQGNQEIAPAVQAAAISKSLAMTRLQQAAMKADAVGVVGARVRLVQLKSYSLPTAFIAWCEAYGSAVVPNRDSRNLNPQTYVSMKG